MNILDLCSIYFVDDANGWVVGEDGIILHTIDGGNRWEIQQSNTKEWLESVYFIDTQTGWIVSIQATLLHTVDGGENWIKQIN